MKSRIVFAIAISQTYASAVCSMDISDLHDVLALLWKKYQENESAQLRQLPSDIQSGMVI